MANSTNSMPLIAIGFSLVGISSTWSDAMRGYLLSNGTRNLWIIIGGLRMMIAFLWPFGAPVIVNFPSWVHLPMRIPRFYLPAPLAVGATVALDDHAFNHAVRVLRLKPGAALILFDGEGGAFAATLIEVGKREARARVTEALPGAVESPLRVTLAQGISRGERMDYTLQKAVELGVAAIQPLFTEHGGVDLGGERLARKIQHWRGIVIGACEQCGRNRLPELREPVPLAEWLRRQAANRSPRRSAPPPFERGARPAAVARSAG